MENTVVDLTQFKTLEFQPVVPDWSIPPQSWDIIATMVLGIIAVWAKETWNHYDPKSPRNTDMTKMARMIIPGMFAGLLGGEIATATGHEATTWLYALVIGFSGTPAIEMITTTILAMLEKFLKAMGVEDMGKNIDTAKKDGTIAVYENTSNNSSSDTNVVRNSTVPTVNAVPTGSTQVPVPVISDVRGTLYGVATEYISKDYKWRDILKSDTADKLGVSNEPTPEHRENLLWLFTKVIQPLTDKWGSKLKINSTYRSSAVNLAVKGAKASDHLTGKSCDIEPTEKGREEEFFKFCVSQMNTLSLPIRIIIGEFPDSNGVFKWVHISGDRDGSPDKLVRIAEKVNGQTVYSPITEQIKIKYNL